MKARRLGVSTICAMFSRVRSKTSGSSCSSRNAMTSCSKARCSGEKSKSMRRIVRGRPTRPAACGQEMTPRSRRPASSASLRPSSAANTAAVCSPTHGTRVSGPSLIFDSFTGLPGHEHRVGDTVGARHLDEHVAGGDMRIGDHVGGVVARARDHPRLGELARRFELRALRRPRVDRGPDLRLERGRPAGARREARIVAPLRMPDEVAEVPELVLAHDLRDDVTVGRAEALADDLRAPCPARAARRATRSW